MPDSLDVLVRARLRALPADTRTALAAAAALADPQFKARLADLGGTVIAGSSSDFGRFVAAETDKWAKVVKFAGIKQE